MIPDFQSIMLPLLKYAGDKKEHSVRNAIETLADEFNLTEEERKGLLQSGQQTIFDNRVGWAKTHLKKASLLELTKRGYFRITDTGLKVLDDNPQEINVKYLKQYPEFVEFIRPSTSVRDEIEALEIKEYEGNTPEELMGIGHQKL